MSGQSEFLLSEILELLTLINRNSKMNNIEMKCLETLFDNQEDAFELTNPTKLVSNCFNDANIMAEPLVESTTISDWELENEITFDELERLQEQFEEADLYGPDGDYIDTSDDLEAPPGFVVEKEEDTAVVNFLAVNTLYSVLVGPSSENIPEAMLLSSPQAHNTTELDAAAGFILGSIVEQSARGLVEIGQLVTVDSLPAVQHHVKDTRKQQACANRLTVLELVVPITAAYPLAGYGSQHKLWKPGLCSA